MRSAVAVIFTNLCQMSTKQLFSGPAVRRAGLRNVEVHRGMSG